MHSASHANKEKCFILFIYSVSYSCYSARLHPLFDISPVRHFMQYLDTALLENDLLRSLWYLHSQPPLLNMLAGVALKLSHNHADLVLAAVYFLAGAAGLIYLGSALMLLEVRVILRVLLYSWLCFYPTFIFYAKWAYAAHLEFSLSCPILYYLVRIFQEPRLSFKSGWQLFLPCMLLGLMRSQWNLLLFIGVLLAIVSLRRGAPGKNAFTQGCFTALMPVIILYAKNAMVFGVWGASSWMGMNLAEVTVNMLPEQNIVSLQQSGIVSPSFPVHYRTEKADSARAQWEAQGRRVIHLEHPSLEARKSNGDRNDNYLAYIEGSKQDMADSLALIAYAPLAYWRDVTKNIVDTAQTPTTELRVGPGWRHSFNQKLKELGLNPVLRAGTIILYVICPLLVLLLAYAPGSYIAQYRPVILTTLLLAAAIAFSSSAFTYGGENVRMRWGVGSFYLAYAALLMEYLSRLWEVRNR